jgi:hypothetical protein
MQKLRGLFCPGLGVTCASFCSGRSQRPILAEREGKLTPPFGGGVSETYRLDLKSSHQVYCLAKLPSCFVTGWTQTPMILHHEGSKRQWINYLAVETYKHNSVYMNYPSTFSVYVRNFKRKYIRFFFSKTKI